MLKDVYNKMSFDFWWKAYSVKKRNYIKRILPKVKYNKDGIITHYTYSGYDLSIRNNSTDWELLNSIIIGDELGNRHIFPEPKCDLFGELLKNNRFCGEYYLVEDYLKTLSTDKPIVLDFGANIGLFTRLVLKHKPNAMVTAVEPETSNFRVMERNLRFFSNVRLMNNGVWDKDCELELYDRGTGEWGFAVREADNPSNSCIHAVSIENIVNSYNVIDLVKMDIEGSEVKIFSDTDNLKWLNKVNAIVVETHDNIIPGADKLVNSVLKERGFIRYQYLENQFFIKKEIWEKAKN